MIRKRDKLYVRVSTKLESQKDSPEHQESFIREIAGREGTEFGEDDVYLDRDSATNITDREDVQRMIEDAKRGEARSIWFASLSRFARDAHDAISLKRILVNALKVRVVSIEDNYDSSVKDDELLFGVKAFVNQNQSEQTGISSRRGIRQSALENLNYIGTIPPFGYKKIKIDDPSQKSGIRKTLERIEEQAKIVELIYDLYIDHGYGDKLIVNFLNGDNPNSHEYGTYTGGPWTLTAVQAVLENPIYTGYNVAGRYKSEVSYEDITDLMKRKKKLVKQPRENWEWSKVIAHPVIIPLERWNIAQDVRLQRGGGKRGGNRAFVNVFAKMIFCSECGSAMVTMNTKTTIGSGKEYRYLVCSRRRRMGIRGCKNEKWIPYYDFRDELMSEILKRLREKLKRIESGEISIAYPDNNHDKDKRRLEKRVDDNRKLLFEIRRQNMLGELDKAQYEYELEQYEKEITEAEKQLTKIATEEKRVRDRSRIIKEAQMAISGLTELKSYNDIEKVRPLIFQCVKQINVRPDGQVDIHTYV